MIFTLYMLPLILGFLSGFLFQAIMKFLLPKNATKKQKQQTKNIGFNDRVFRATTAAILLVIACIFPHIQFMALLLAGFNIFQSVFSWCVFYQAIGKDTCPR